MANEVYANTREVSCKAAAGKSIAAFPDVCLSPPSPPAGPVPIPYPNTAMASDTSGGSKTVQISGQEVMLKDSSFFKQSSGDEAATKSLGMGVVTHTIQGKAYFAAWSMDVKIEGENAVRHMDMMTHNHNPPPGNSPPWLYQDSMAMGDTTNPCNTTASNVEKACTNKNYKNDQSGKCCEAKKCVLAPYGSQPECCEPPERTKHHCVPDHCFKEPGETGRYYPGIKGMSHGKGLCICVTGKDKNEKRKQHAKIHNDFDTAEDNHYPKWTFKEAKEEAASACSKHTKCDEDCLKHQIDQYHKDFNVDDYTALRADSGGNYAPPPYDQMGTTAAAASGASA
jgi:hypothetical protein